MSNRWEYPPAFHPQQKRFTIQRPSSRTRRRSVRLAPIAENPRLQPPVGVWAVLSPSDAGRALTPATHRSLGRPLPHQQANRTWTHPGAESHLWSGDIIRYYLQFPVAIPSPGADFHALLSLPPLALRPARLACLIHADNVHSEPGSNPSKSICFRGPCLAAQTRKNQKEVACLNFPRFASQNFRNHRLTRILRILWGS